MYRDSKTQRSGDTKETKIRQPQKTRRTAWIAV